MKYIASCSFGKDSLAMVLRLIEEQWPLDEIIFFDTGMEFDSIYTNRDKIKKIIGDISFAELRDKDEFYYKMFVKPVKYRNPEGKEHPYHYGYEWCGGNVVGVQPIKLEQLRNTIKIIMATNK